MSYKVVVAGHRDARDKEEFLFNLEKVFGHRKDLEIVSSGRPGADMAAVHWAHKRGFTVTVMEDPHPRVGKNAKPPADRERVEYADATFFTPGANGTLPLMLAAQKRGIPMFSSEDGLPV